MMALPEMALKYEGGDGSMRTLTDKGPPQMLALVPKLTNMSGNMQRGLKWQQETRSLRC